MSMMVSMEWGYLVGITKVIITIDTKGKPTGVWFPDEEQASLYLSWCAVEAPEELNSVIKILRFGHPDD